MTATTQTSAPQLNIKGPYFALAAMSVFLFGLLICAFANTKTMTYAPGEVALAILACALLAVLLYYGRLWFRNKVLRVFLCCAGLVSFVAEIFFLIQLSLYT